MTDTQLHDTTDDTTNDTVLEDAWLAAPTRRSRARNALLCLLAAAVVFLGGVLTQKHLGADTTTGAAGIPGAGQLPGGGVLPEGVELPDGVELPGAGTQPDVAVGGGSGDDEAVIGTVVAVRGDTWVVEDLGGERHRVTVDADTDVVRERDLDAADVTTGSRVDISGTADDGSIRAQDVTVR